jgi:cell division protein FtsB
MIRESRLALTPLDGLIFVVIALALGNFLYTAFHGDHGAVATLSIEVEAREARAMLETLHQERAQLDNRIARLSEAYLDGDLLDETARDMLGLLGPRERMLAPLDSGAGDAR